MYCKYCGERIEDGARVCRYCGKEQEESGGIRIDIGRDMGKYQGVGVGAKGVVKNIGDGSIFIEKKHENSSTNVDNKGGIIQRSTIGSGDERIEICPYCGKELNFPKPPRFCPYCKEQIME